jgi:hypothetical protein
MHLRSLALQVGNFYEVLFKNLVMRDYFYPKVLEISMLINACNSNKSLAESSCQLSELDAMDARVESIDTHLKSLQSPDGKASGSPFHNKSPTLQRNFPFSLPKSPRYSPRPRFHCNPSLADRLDIPSSPLLPKKTDNNDVGVQREVSLSPSIKGILKSHGLSCPTACKCDICYSIQVRSEKASEFSQRQMCDIEALAHNLLKELKTMRTIVEQNLTFETDLSSPSSKFTVEEVFLYFPFLLCKSLLHYCKLYYSHLGAICASD